MSLAKQILLLLGCALASIAQAQDAENGKKTSKMCASYHQVGDGARHRVGPVSIGLIGRVAGSYDGYAYGKSLQAAGAAGLIWAKDTLFGYLADPTVFLRAELDGSKARVKMSFSLKREGERRDVIAYPATFSIASLPETEAEMQDDMPVKTAADMVCVRNRNTHEYLFAVEVDGDNRKVAILKPGEVLCTHAERPGGQGVVTVYEHAEAFEGCSRLVPVGRTEDMLKYVDFDRCFWSSNT